MMDWENRRRDRVEEVRQDTERSDDARLEHDADSNIMDKTDGESLCFRYIL